MKYLLLTFIVVIGYSCTFSVGEIGVSDSFNEDNQISSVSQNQSFCQLPALYLDLSQQTRMYNGEDSLTVIRLQSDDEDLKGMWAAVFLDSYGSNPQAYVQTIDSELKREVHWHYIAASSTSSYSFDKASGSGSTSHIIRDCGELELRGFWGDCGQAVADCIDQAYTGCGWASVGLWIATAFIPEVAVATAIVCTSHC